MPRETFPAEVADRQLVSAIRDRQRVDGRIWEDIDLDRSHFWVCRSGAECIAWVGLELDASNALLRSLFTEPAYRKRGIGRHLVQSVTGVVPSGHPSRRRLRRWHS